MKSTLITHDLSEPQIGYLFVPNDCWGRIFLFANKFFFEHQILLTKNNNNCLTSKKYIALNFEQTVRELFQLCLVGKVFNQIIRSLDKFIPICTCVPCIATTLTPKRKCIFIGSKEILCKLSGSESTLSQHDDSVYIEFKPNDSREIWDLDSNKFLGIGDLILIFDGSQTFELKENKESSLL